MIIKIFKIIAFSFLIVINTNAYSLGNSGWTTVVEILQGPGSSPTVKLQDMGATTTTCNNSSSLRFRNADTDVGKRHFSTLLTALSSGKEVHVRTIECSADFAYIEEIRIRN